PDSANYSFRAMAQDQVEVMKALGHERFYVAGHDRGGRTTHRMCLDHPEKVIKAAIIDIVPTLDMWAAMNKEAAISGWHWPLMAPAGRLSRTNAGWCRPRLVHAQKAVEVDREPQPHPAGNLERVRSLLQRKDDPRFVRRLSRRSRDRLPTRHRRPWPQARSADPGAVGRSEQRRQTLCRPARLVEIARRRRPRRSATDRTLCERGGSRSGACLVPGASLRLRSASLIDDKEFR